MQSRRLSISPDSQGPFRAPVNHGPALPAHEAPGPRDKPTAELHPVFSPPRPFHPQQCAVPGLNGPAVATFHPRRILFVQTARLGQHESQMAHKLQPTSTRLNQTSTSLVQCLFQPLHLPTVRQKTGKKQRQDTKKVPLWICLKLPE